MAVYKRPHNGECPLVCLDETSKQLLADRRAPIPMKPGHPARCDYEYERNRTANLFMMFAPLEGWRRVKVTDRRTAVDYAQALEDLSDRQSLGNRVDLNTALQGGTLPIYMNLEFHVSQTELEGMIMDIKKFIADLTARYRKLTEQTPSSSLPSPGAVGDVNAAHEAGRKAGYEAGHAEGYRAGREAGHEAGHAEGYEAGRKFGHEAGHAEGYEAGREAGYEAGYAKGYKAGREAGHEAGHAEGYEAGQRVGHEAGHAEGYEAGREAGHEAGYEKGYDEGYRDWFRGQDATAI